ncbi:NADH-quinone oxidoreductase subunit C [Kitasatospora sp. NBC_00240]|uniref:NADH-quinone oxidoreductase subunit C n=1 Tax=Kitasatospora sp. NBC_00240 TaxID=2903567 RepID=UPI002259F637|nr:NADH-quinone oxidoreductase subunit C [Kitasatospora sp. NBC_00240]MCX5212285.1 NADH-quinone oxidoreductase subunit C [Kitasatospora sp. NBC_00240]
MSFDRTPEELAASIGEWATAAEAYELITVDVPAEHWIEALTAARDILGLSWFDWLSAVDELAEGFSVAAHLAALDDTGVRHLLVRTRVPRERAVLPTAIGVYAGAGWHERETHEMFGIDFAGHPHLVTLLLPDGFEGHPLRKEFVLAARVAKAWPGAKEPGESEGDGPARRKMQPAGVPDPNEWGPLKGTLPPVAERPARGARATGAAGRAPRAPGAAGAAAVGAAGAAGAAGEGGPAIRADRPRRTRSITEGSASQSAATPAGAPAEPAAATPTVTPPAATPPAPARTQSSDAPWHAPVPAHGPVDKPAPPTPDVPAEPPATPAPEAPKPEAPKPEAPKPDAVQPEAPKPEAAEPEAAEPEARQPSAAEPEAGTPEAPETGTDRPTQEGDSA